MYFLSKSGPKENSGKLKLPLKDQQEHIHHPESFIVVFLN